ncbi:GNAT family N-acetyltransferase [Oryzicola mucosus]|uniref:GNAT family N-acetyltransferase n=1 Tax=Oryzicola mucosus TaxID=2767425 RepID=A0A8J6PR33_9HYPH|nr:GNAT family N-acetyltransferase [Oryzicola mucosus]MBD0413549.1 GNAT family N-acetyltransferase [Oryzicola mucosus]
MAAIPLMEEMRGGPAGTLIAGMAGVAESPADPTHVELIETNRQARRLSIYPASAGFDLVEELDFLSARTIEPNVFFNPRFLAPAMPRLEDREVRLAVIRDGDEYSGRLRMLLPFSVEKPPIPLGVTVMRTWSSPFGPLGMPLIDRDDPEGVVEDLISIMSRPHLKLPSVFVLPDIRLDGPVARMLRSVAETGGLPLVITSKVERPFLHSDLDGDAYLRRAISPHHYRNLARLKRRLSEQGVVEHVTARSPNDIRPAVETFLTLEASGWKGRARSAMVNDRLRAAFAREAIHGLAERDKCRIHQLTLDGRVIASLVVFVEAGVAYSWKTAYDESLSAYSPGVLLVAEVTRQHLEDPNIDMTDSCTVPDHPVMSRLWTERRPIGTMVIGMRPNTDRITRQAASQLHLYRETRNMMRLFRNRVKAVFRKK